jgi:hypothetical protein
MTTQLSAEAVAGAMDVLAGNAPRTGRSVRGVAQWAHNQQCPTNNAMFAARVDGDRLLKGTTYAPEFGQSPFALTRGARVESIGRANSYAVTVDLLRKHFGFGIEEVIPLDLRHGFALNHQGMEKRAKLTAQAIEASLLGRRDAPNIIDGAVLSARIGGFDAHLEADGVGARAGPVFHINEFKGWAVVDGRADDAGKLGATIRQMGIYRYLLSDLIERLRGSPDTMSEMGLLVTPKNVGMTLIGSPIDLSRPTIVAQTTLANLPDPAHFVGAVAPQNGFGPVSDTSAQEDQRLEALERLADTLGTRYQETCLASCGLAKFCRARAHAASAPALAGTAISRFLPGIVSLRRAADLADGAPPRELETQNGAADILLTAARLYHQKMASPPTPAAATGKRVA